MSEHGHDKEDPLKAQTSFEPVKQFVPGPRMFGYGVGFFIYFALSTTAMAMVSATPQVALLARARPSLAPPFQSPLAAPSPHPDHAC